MADPANPAFDPATAEHLLRHREWVRRLARSLVSDAATADDVEQETWLAALRRPPGSGEASARWLARVVRSRAIDVFRRRTRRAARERNHALPEELPSAGETVARAEAHRIVVEAVMALDEPMRTAVLLRYFEELPPREVARRLGVPVETARKRIQRGVERLRERLAPADDPRARERLLLLILPRSAGASPERGGRGAPPAATLGGTLAMAIGTKKLVVAAVVIAALAVAAHRWTREPDSGGAARVAAPSQETAADVAAERAARAARTETAASPTTESPAPSDVAPAAARLRVRREDAGPVEGAAAVLHDGTRVLATGRLTADGVLGVPATNGECRLAVAVAGRAPQSVVVPPCAGEVDVVLPRGRAVAGRVLLDGASPEERVPLDLWLDAGVLPHPVEAELPEEEPAGLPNPGRAAFRGAAVRTAADGTFRIEGFAPDASGGVAPPWGWRPKTPDAGRFAAPRENVILDCTRSPRVTGRLVRRGDATPLGEASVVFSGTLATGGWSSRCLTDADGRFVQYFTHTVPVPDCALLVLERGGVPSLRWTLAGPFDRDRDLGTIAVEDPWRDAGVVRVVDAAGEPVAGAVVALAESAASWRGVSGPEGLVRVPGASSGAQVVVCALGHGTATVTVAPGDTPVVASLPTGATLTIGFAGPQRLPPGIVVRVGAPRALFDEPADALADVLRSALHAAEPTASLRGAGEGDAEDVSWFVLGERLGEDGTLVVPWLRPGVPFRVQTFDPWGEPLAEADVTLRSGETRDLRLDAPEWRAVEGRVEDESGRLLPDAEVEVRSVRADDDAAWSGGWSETVTTRERGRFVLQPVCGAALTMIVRAPGHVPWARRAVATDAGEIVVRMARGRRLSVRVLHADGTPADPDELVAAPVDARAFDGVPVTFDVQPAEAGTWTVDGLPDGEVDLAAEAAGGARTTARVRTDRGTVDLVLPPAPSTVRDDRP